MMFRFINILPKGPGKRVHIVADTLFPMMFHGLRKLGNICCGHKMFLNKIRNIFCVLDTKFVSATNVARAGKRGNICVGNNVSATMCQLSWRRDCDVKAAQSVDAQQLWARPSLRAFAGEFFTEEIEIKGRVAIMLFKLNSVFVSTGHDNDKPERINISIFSGCCRL